MLNTDKNVRLAFLIDVAVLIILSIVLFSCDHTTKPKTYSISGYVSYSNREGLEGATVLVYNHIPLDQSISTFKTSYPNHGASLGYYDTFDHRTTTPIAQIQTDQMGTFTLVGIEKGSYNLVAYKDGYGYTYLKNIVVEANVSSVQLHLAPVVNLSNVISESIELEDNRVYNVPVDLVILPDVDVTVGTNSTLVLSPGIGIDIHGNMITGSESLLNIMSSDKLYSHSNLPGSVGKLDSVTFYNQESAYLQNIRCMDSISGLRFVGTQNSGLSNSYIVALYQAVSVIYSSKFALRASTVSESIENLRSAVNIEDSPYITIEKCHFFDNKIGVRIFGSSGAIVRNNYFKGNDIYDFGFADGGAGTVEYNTFRGSNTAIYNYRGQMFVNYNDIEAITGIHSLRVDAWFSAKYNNLNCSGYGIKSQCMYWHYNIVHLDCTRNYWYTNDLAQIADKVYDRYDESPSDENYLILVTYVDYTPISSIPQNAGVYN